MLTNAERQARFRQNQQKRVAELEARVAELEAQLAVQGSPSAAKAETVEFSALGGKISGEHTFTGLPPLRRGKALIQIDQRSGECTVLGGRLEPDDAEELADEWDKYRARSGIDQDCFTQEIILDENALRLLAHNETWCMRPPEDDDEDEYDKAERERLAAMTDEEREQEQERERKRIERQKKQSKKEREKFLKEKAEREAKRKPR